MIDHCLVKLFTDKALASDFKIRKMKPNFEDEIYFSQISLHAKLNFSTDDLESSILQKCQLVIYATWSSCD